MARPPSPRRDGSTVWRPPEMARSLQSAVELIARASDHAVRLAQEGDRVRPMRVLIELDVFAATPLQPRLARYVAQRIRVIEAALDLPATREEREAAHAL